MKFSLLIWFGSVSILATAQQDSLGIVMTKKITKTFDAVGRKKLSIDNAYGDVEVRTWNRKNVLINITVIATAKTSTDAKNLLTRIVIVEGQSDNAITCRTNIGGTDSLPAKIKPQPVNEKCTINYIIYMPGTLALKIKNQFGNIKMGDYPGGLEINESFGDFTAGILSTATLTAALGSIHIKKIFEGEVRGKGFGFIKIDTIAGNVGCGLSAGKMLDIGFINGHYNFMLKSDNIGLVNVRLPKNFGANITATGVFSTFENKSSFTLNTIQPSKPSRPKDISTIKPPIADTSKIKLFDKKKLELNFLKKTTEYKGTAGDGGAVLTIGVSFSKVTLTN